MECQLKLRDISENRDRHQQNCDIDQIKLITLCFFIIEKYDFKGILKGFIDTVSIKVLTLIVSFMDKLNDAKIKVIAAGIASLFFIAAASLLLIFGGLSVAKDGMKVFYYRQTNCTIQNITWKAINHLQFHNHVERYVAAWGLTYEGHHAFAQGTKQYIFHENALAEANKYKVISRIGQTKMFPLCFNLDSFISFMLV